MDVLNSEIIYEYWTSLLHGDESYENGYPEYEGESPVIGVCVRKFGPSEPEKLWYEPWSGSGHSIEGEMVYQDDEGFVWHRKGNNQRSGLYLAFRAMTAERFKKLYGKLPEGVTTTDELNEHYRKKGLSGSSEWGSCGYRSYRRYLEDDPETIVHKYE